MELIFFIWAMLCSGPSNPSGPVFMDGNGIHYYSGDGSGDDGSGDDTGGETGHVPPKLPPPPPHPFP